MGQGRGDFQTQVLPTRTPATQDKEPRARREGARKARRVSHKAGARGQPAGAARDRLPGSGASLPRPGGGGGQHKGPGPGAGAGRVLSASPEQPGTQGLLAPNQRNGKAPARKSGLLATTPPNALSGLAL